MVRSGMVRYGINFVVRHAVVSVRWCEVWFGKN